MGVAQLAEREHATLEAGSSNLLTHFTWERNRLGSLLRNWAVSAGAASEDERRSQGFLARLAEWR